MTVVLPAKDPSEVIAVLFDFTAALEESESLATVVGVTAHNAEDTSASNILLGAPILDGPVVQRWIRGGVAPTRYHLRATVTTSAGRTLVAPAELPVENI